MVLKVKLHDGRTFAAHVEDIDLNSDLATLRIKAVSPLFKNISCKIFY